MSFSAIAAISFGDTGWLALELVASEISSLSQPASSTPAASAAERDERANQRAINQCKAPHPTGNFRTPTYSVHALKPLSKILSFGPHARKPIRASAAGSMTGMVNRG